MLSPSKSGPAWVSTPRAIRQRLAFTSQTVHLIYIEHHLWCLQEPPVSWLHSCLLLCLPATPFPNSFCWRAPTNPSRPWSLPSLLNSDCPFYLPAKDFFHVCPSSIMRQKTFSTILDIQTKRFEDWEPGQHPAMRLNERDRARRGKILFLWGNFDN